MSFKATHKTTGDVIEYDTPLPLPEHLTADWRLEEVSVATIAPALPAHGIKCGEFGDLPAAIAQSLAASGEFDPKAVEA